MKNENLVPKVRFKGFSDPWEQRKLGNIASKVNEKNRNSEYRTVLTNSATKGIIRQTDYFDRKIAQNVENYYIVRDQYFIYNPRISVSAPYGPIRINRLGITGVMSPLYVVFSVNNIDNVFLEYFFKTSFWYKFMYENGDSGARADRFAIKDNTFFSMPITIPETKEQARIGKVLDRVANLIAANEDKLEQLKTLKKLMMQKIFSQEWRFKGFTDPWEQRKLGSIAKVTKLAGFEFTKYIIYSDNGKIIVLRGLNVKNGKLNLKDVKYIDQSNLEKIKRSKLIKNDIVYSYVGTVGESAVISEDDRFYLAPNVALVRVNQDIDGHFIHQIFSSQKFKTKIVFPLISSSSQPALSMESIRKFKLNLPSKAEQKQLTILLGSIDNLIAANEDKLNQLKKLKKYLMQNMFV